MEGTGTHGGPYRDARLKVARDYLGETANLPLVAALLRWIPDDHLWVALEEVGLVKGGTGKLITVQEATEQALRIMREELKTK